MIKNIRALKKKVVVAMSGGVDSSVSAALLKEQGFDVVGVFMRVWNGVRVARGDTPDVSRRRNATSGVGESGCPWVEDQFEARRAAEHLGIPFYTLNLEKEYKKAVVDYFFKEYAAGRTPNPDVLCNSEIKFGVFLKRMLGMGADYIATGHYAKISQKYPVGLLRGVDIRKDQSYFLWRLKPVQLSKVIFPIGDYTKPEVRELAKKFGLPNADRKDSQGICFIGPVDIQEFLKTQLPVKKGQVVTTDGQEVGEHDGIWFYTIGQRHGVVKRFKGAQGVKGEQGDFLPLYVVSKDLKTNTLVVGQADDPKLWARGMIISGLNWLINSKFKAQNSKLECQCQVRYQQKPFKCEIRPINETNFEVMFSEPVRAVTPGQSAVFFDGDLLLGGGVIEKAV